MMTLRSVVWFCKATRESLCWTFVNDRHLGEQRRSKIYKLWALLLIIVPGKCDQVVLYQIEV